MAQTSAGRSKARQSRARDERALTMFLVHEPTGVRVEGEIPAGRYSKADMKSRSDVLYERLLAELEDRVAGVLRIPGRSRSAAC